MKIQQEIFTNALRFAKFANIFFCELFPLYSTSWSVFKTLSKGLEGFRAEFESWKDAFCAFY